jgi:hypothetical protein
VSLMDIATLRSWAFNQALVSKDVLDGWRHRLQGQAEATAFDQDHEMAFIIGCGRSGTTILGESLGAHSQIAYLNEPQDIWFSGWPSMDLWSPLSSFRSGRLDHAAADATPAAVGQVKAVMARAAGATRQIVEKWPINCFHMELICEAFPKAKFIWLKRPAWPVARSIERCVETDASWWGLMDYKWRAIKAYALARPQYADLVPLAEKSHFHRGLLEWRLSRDAMDIGFARIPAENVYSLQYDDFVGSAIEQGRAMAQFLHLQPCESFEQFLHDKVRAGRQEDLEARKDQDALTIVGEHG